MNKIKTCTKCSIELNKISECNEINDKVFCGKCYKKYLIEHCIVLVILMIIMGYVGYEILGIFGAIIGALFVFIFQD